MLPEPNGFSDAQLLQHFEKTLQESVGTRRYQSWFSSKTRFTLSGDDLTVLAASPYLVNWLQRRFQTQIREVAERSIGAGVRLQWEVDATLAPPDSLTGHASDTAASVAANGPSAKTGGLPASDQPSVRFAVGGVDPAGGPVKGSGIGAPRDNAIPRRIYELDAFFAGAGNAMALMASRQVVDAPGMRFSPLYLYGGVGTGKTHLLEGIGRELRRRAPSLRVISMTAESFVNCYTQAIETRTLASFRQKFRSVDALLIDDVDFLDGRGGLQDEFLHTLKKLEEGGKQVVLTGDRHPQLLTKTSDELVTRFQAGMVSRLEAPDLQTRRSIVSHLAANLGFPVADDALEFVAEKFRGNVRELEGAMNCLHTWHLVTGRRVLVTNAREVLARLERDCTRFVRMADVEQAVCSFFGVGVDELKSDSKSRSLVQPRMLAMYLSRRLTTSAYSEIGSYFGGRKHTTAIAAEKKINEQVQGSETIRVGLSTWKLSELVETLSQQIRAS